MPVLFGVFLYMGISSLRGVQVCVWISLAMAGDEGGGGGVIPPWRH